MASGPEEKAQTTLNYLGVQVLELIFFFLLSYSLTGADEPPGVWLEITGIK